MFLKQVFDVIINSHCIMLTKQQQKTKLNIRERLHYGYKYQMSQRNTKKENNQSVQVYLLKVEIMGDFICFCLLWGIFQIFFKSIYCFLKSE